MHEVSIKITINDKVIEKNIKLNFIGELNNLPVKLQKLIKPSEKKTKNKKKFDYNLSYY